MSEPEAADGAEAPLPTSPEALLQRLDDLGIAYRNVSHPPVFTVEEAKALRGELPGHHIKNLFLRNKKGQMWLVTCLEDRAVDLKVLAERLGAGRFSFGSADRLMTYLGVRPGAVTPFAVINDKEGAVTMVLDSGMMVDGPGPEKELVNCHPLVNTMTTALAPADLVHFLEAEGHAPLMLDFQSDHV
jgi:Ala-tRNA(Pro) deacylase